MLEIKEGDTIRVWDDRKNPYSQKPDIEGTVYRMVEGDNNMHTIYLNTGYTVKIKVTKKDGS